MLGITGLSPDEVASRYDAVLNSLQDGLIVAEGDGSIRLINPAALSILGFESVEKLQASLDQFTLLDGAGRQLPRNRWPLERVLEGEILSGFEIVIHRAGQSRTVSYSSGNLRDESGKITLAVLSLRDVTAQRASESALRESEEQRRLAIESARLGAWNWNLVSGELTWNRRCKMLFGFGPDEQIDIDKFYSVLHPGDVERTRTAVETSLRTGRDYETEYRAVWPDGSVHWIGAWGSTVFDAGKAINLHGVVIDIDEKRRVEDSLRESSATMRAVLDASPSAILTTSIDGVVTSWNPAAESIFGYAPHEVIGKKCPFPIGPADSTLHDELQLRRADGALIDVSCSTAPLRDASGSIHGQVAILSDLTESRKIQRQMEHTQRLESLGVLAGGVAHDFNNLLTGILGNASLGLYVVEPGHEVRPLLDEVVRAGERAADLTRQLLAYAGKGRFVTRVLDLSAAVREIAVLAQTSVQNKKVRLELNLDHAPLWIDADPAQVQQVILNLVINGAEAVPADEPGFVRIATRKQWFSVALLSNLDESSAASPGHFAVLEVQDTGTGMDPATKARIFEPFFSTKFTGRGLGLSAVTGIVRGHHGGLGVTTKLGQGSTFQILFPLQADQVPTEVDGVPSARLRDTGAVLVIDDEETVRSALRRALESWGYQPFFAENGQAAVESLPFLPPNLKAIILDLAMPVMGGEETLEHLRRELPSVPVILTSGYSEADAMQRLAGRGVRVFLQKPFTVGQVAKILRDLTRS